MHGHEADEFVVFVTAAERFIEIHMEEGIDREWSEILAGRYMAAAASGGFMSEEGVRREAKRELQRGDEEGEMLRQAAKILEKKP